MSKENSTTLSYSLVVTNYKSWDMVMKCVNQHVSLENLDEIIVVDDCSGEDAPIFDDAIVKIIYNSTNMGFVKSVNVGMKHAKNDMVLLFDADAYPLVSYSEVLLERFSKEPKLGALGFYTFDENGQQTASFEKEPTIWSLILGQQVYFRINPPNQYSKEQMVIYSCALALRRQAFLEDGGFDEQIDWMDPDVDKCISMRRRGWEIDVDSRLRAFHKGGGVPQLTSQRVVRQYKSRWYVLDKHGKIPFKLVSNKLIQFRLLSEYVFLACFARFLYPQDIAFDKTSGRKSLIRMMQSYLN